MGLGYTADKARLDATLGQLATQLHSVMDTSTKLKAWLDTKTVADLQAMGYLGPGNTPDETAYVKSMVADAAKIAQVFHGTTTQATAYDFTTFLKYALGVGLY